MTAEMISALSVAFAALCLWNERGTLAFVQWDRHDVQIVQGGELTLTCTATDLELLDVVRISRKDASGMELAIADNENVKSQFSSSTHLKVFYDFHQNRSATSVLQYHGVRGEDAGIIHCYRLGDETNSDSLNLTVLVPVDSVKFSTISVDGSEKMVEDDEIILVEDVLLGLACTVNVNDSLSSPAVTIFVDSEDVSHLFTPTEQSRIIRSDSGLEYFFSEKKLRHDTRKPDPKWNDAKLVCIAKQNGLPDVTATAFLRVQYQPIITCSKAVEYAKVGDSVTLTCKVASNPGSTIVWTRNGEERLTQDNSYSFSENVIKPDISQVSLSFIAINDSHFSTYTITARNDHGQDEDEIALYLLTSSGLPADSRGNRRNEQNDAKYSVPQSETSDFQGHGKSQGSLLSSNIGMRISAFAHLGIIYTIIRQLLIVTNVLFWSH